MRYRHCILLLTSTCSVAVMLAIQGVASEETESRDPSLSHQIGRLELVNLQALPTEFEGKKCLQLVAPQDGECLALLRDVEFQNGTIELELVGRPRQRAPAFAKGFIGVAFRLNNDGAFSYENIYLRPLNSRAKDSEQRSHTTQYCSIPDYPWHRLREESPGVYESHVDIDKAGWTKVKNVVKDKSAKMFVNESNEPCLVVNDLKLESHQGAVAIWMHSTTEAFVRNFDVTPAP